jgi:hypothetical protein
MANLGQSRLAVPIFVLAALLVAALPAMAERGPWYDEFYSLYAADPTVAFWAALNERWLPDNHPPLFYALAWATGWLGDGVEPRRYVNLFILAGFIAGFAMLWRQAPLCRIWGPMYLVALAGMGLAVQTMAELRSGFLVLASASLLVAALATVANPVAPPATRRGWLVLAGAMLVALNAHFVATVICGCLIACFGMWALLHRNYRVFGLLAACTVLASIPFLLTTAVQLGTIEQNTRTFWIPAGFDAGRWVIQGFAQDLALGNIVLTLLATFGLAKLAWEALRMRQWHPDMQLVAVLGAGMLLAIAVVLALHMLRPIIVGRYLVALGPGAALVLAIGATNALSTLNGLLRFAAMAAVLMIMGLSLFHDVGEVRSKPSWAGTARRIAEIVVTCPETVVHPALHWNAYTMDLPPADNRVVVPMAYRHMASSFGFAVEGADSRRTSATCPDIFWAEHVSGQEVDERRIADELRREGYSIRRTRLERIGDGWLLISGG